MPQVSAPILSRPEVISHILADNNYEERKKHHEHPPHLDDHHHLGMPHWFRTAGPMPISNITVRDIEILLHQLLSSPQPHRITSNSKHNVIPEIGREPWFRFPSIRVSWPNRPHLADLYYGGTGESTRAPEHTTITPKVTMTPPRHENNNAEHTTPKPPEHTVRPVEVRPPEHTTITPKVTMTPPRHENNNAEHTTPKPPEHMVRPVEVRPPEHTPYFRYNFLPFTHSYNPVIPKQPPMYHVVFDHNLLTL